MTIDIVQLLKARRVLPLVVLDDPARAAPVAAALVAGGLPLAEVAFRTPAAGEALRRMADASQEICVGAGTVLTEAQAWEAIDAGARFIVAPGFNERVVRWCQEREVPVFPGVCTPTEIDTAMSCGLEVLKFFPAEPMGGLSFLRAVAAPFQGVDFIPTGGLSALHLADYLAFDRVLACGGSWMVPTNWIAAGDFERVQAEVARTVSVVRSFSPAE